MSKFKVPGKWIEELHSDMPVDEAARHVLEIRLKAIEKALPLAHHHPEDDIEYVHQLRVATRRADAAIRIFRPFVNLPKRKKMRKRLRQIRRAAGEARICDVHRVAFVDKRRQAQGHQRAILEEIISWNDAERRRAQKSLDATAEQYPIKKLKRARERLGDHLEPANGKKKKSAPTLIQAARKSLPSFVDSVREDGQADLAVYDNLHQFRISGKRLRYAMEVFAPCFGDEFKQLYDRVEKLQDRLGAINDTVEIIERLTDFATDIQEDDAGLSGSLNRDDRQNAIERLLDEYRHSLNEQTQIFLEEWNRGDWSSLFDEVLACIESGKQSQAGSKISHSGEVRKVEVRH